MQVATYTLDIKNMAVESKFNVASSLKVVNAGSKALFQNLLWLCCLVVQDSKRFLGED